VIQEQKKMNRSVSVIGAGTMGNGIAHVFAKAGL
jgi:3-hydroxyacyl-CoA dehydrogenase